MNTILYFTVKIEHTGGCAPCRNLGIDWIRENANNGVVYFADDDNTYDLALFDEVTYLICIILLLNELHVKRSFN